MVGISYLLSPMERMTMRRTRNQNSKHLIWARSLRVREKVILRTMTLVPMKALKPRISNLGVRIQIKFHCYL